MRYITGGRPTPRDEIENDILPWWLGYYERFAGYGFWAAIERDAGEFIGWFHLRPPEDEASAPAPSSATGCESRRGGAATRPRAAGR